MGLRARVHDLEHAARRAARRIVHRVPWPHEDPSALIPEAAGSGCETRLLYLPALPLDYRWQRPQQLAAHLSARGLHVTYVEVFDRCLTHPAQRERRSGECFTQLSLAVPSRPNPFRSRLGARQVDAIASRLPAAVDVVLAQHPLWLPVVERIQERRVPVVYDRIDRYDAFPGRAPATAADDAGLQRLAAAVTFSAEALRPDVGTARQLLVPNAAAVELFALSDPPERPVVGYLGALGEWFDADLVAELACRRPDWSLRIAGVIEERRIATTLGRRSNVRLLGEVPFAGVPDFYRSVSALLIPFRPHPLLRSIDPVKVYEALAAGRPVIAPPLPALARWQPPNVYRFEDPHGAEAQLERAMGEDSPTLRRARRESVGDESWSRRASVLAPVILELAGIPPGPVPPSPTS